MLSGTTKAAVTFRKPWTSRPRRATGRDTDDAFGGEQPRTGKQKAAPDGW
jgi:hypothetical protein